jgi:hypothetical protein
MSATRDAEQHTKFIFSNFYHLYLQSKAAKAGAPADLASGIVLRTRSVTETPAPAQVHVVSSHGNESLKKWVNSSEQKSGRESLASQIHSLRTARKRLNFLMEEIDEILKRD